MLGFIFIITSMLSVQAQEGKDVEIHYRYLFFSDVCYEQFFGKEEIQSECVSDTISRSISILMVACAVFNQMPQIYKIVKNKSVQGISFNAYYTEVIVYQNQFYLLSLIIAYNLHKETKFLLYGESVIVAIEYSIVMTIFIFYDKSMKKSDWLFKMMMFLIINIPLLIGYGPSWIFDSTIYINMVLSIVCINISIFIKVISNIGQMSLLTQLQNQSGSLARLFTLFNDQADAMYIVMSYLYFRFISLKIMYQQLFQHVKLSRLGIKIEKASFKSMIAAVQLSMIKSDNNIFNLMKCEILDWKGYLVQASLGVLSFTILLLKRYFENPKRMWKIFMMDSSKQLLSAFIAHILNVILALELSTEKDGNACVWYFITFMMDSTVGVLFNYLLMKTFNLIFEYYNIRRLQSGNYFKLEEKIKIDWQMYACQLLLWNSVVVVSKFMLFGLQELFANTLNIVGSYALSPIENPELLLVLVMIVIPFIMNAITFWIQDNIIKKNDFSNQEEKQLLIGTYYEGTLTDSPTQELAVF